MTLKLKKLHRLTHEQIDNAIANAIINNPHLKNIKLPSNKSKKYSSQLFFCVQSPYGRLTELLYGNKHDKDFAFGNSVLAELFDVTIEVLNDNLGFLNAVRIFLQFRMYGQDYQSVNGNGNTCLHDAIEIENFSADLITLLIKNGADPDRENDDQLTALAVVIQDYHGYNNKVIAALCDYDKPSHERIIFAISSIMRDANENPLAVLEAADQHGFFDQHPDILNFDCKNSKRSNLLLHTAVESKSSEVVFNMLCNGANPDLLNAYKYRPVDLAVERLMQIQNTSSKAFNDLIKSIAYLLLKSLSNRFGENIPVMKVVDELFMLALIKTGYREKICITLCSMDVSDNLNFTLQDLLNLLQEKSKNISRDEIQFSTVLGGGTYGKVYKGSISDKWGTREIAIKQNMQNISDEYTLRFEANTHSNLKHPNLIQFMGTFERNDCFGIILEYAGGGTLRQFIRAKSDSEVTGCLYSFAKQMNDGLRYIHSEGIVHLDFKPENILIDDADKLDAARIMIADFGAAAKKGETKPENVTTIVYCAPENFDWEIPFEPANDTFGFGVTLGVMETKNDPWKELMHDSLIPIKVSQGKRTTFGNAKMRPEVADLIKLCCFQKPNKRPSCDEIDIHLETKIKPF